jgi:hypothetical protein
MTSQLARTLSRHTLSSPTSKRRTSIDLNRITRHMRTACTRQEQTQSTKITRLSNPARGLARLKSFLVLVQPKVRHARGKHTRTDNIDHNILGREFRCRHLGEMNTSRFGRSVCVQRY